MNRHIVILVKRILSPVMCLRHGIKNHKGYVYIGKGCKFVNPIGVHLERDVSIMPYTMLVCLKKSSQITIGENTQIGMFSRIGSLNNVDIGNEVLTGPHIFIADYNHEYRDIEKSVMNQGNYVSKMGGGIKIGDGTWLGTNVVIAGSIQIGKHCVIGANSVVTKDIPDYCVAAGIPCKIIKKYNFLTKKWESMTEQLR